MRVYTGLDVHSDFGGRFPWTSQLVDVGAGVRMAVVDEGPKDAPATFLLLHGNPTWSYQWRAFIARLSSRYRVVAPDLIGFGRSDKPRDPRWYTLEHHASALTKLVDALGLQRVVPVLHDWGGPIGLSWASRHPARVAGVVVLNTWAFVREPRIRLPLLFRLLVLGRGGWRRSVQGNLFVERFLARGRTDEVLAPYRAPFPTADDRVGIGRFPQLIPQTHDPFHESFHAMAGIEDGLVRLREKPALIVWGEKDRAFGPRVLQRWTRVFAEVDGPHLLPAAGHFLPEDAPDEILAHLERWAMRFGPGAP